jgi:hypothetical protein
MLASRLHLSLMPTLTSKSRKSSVPC